MKKVIVVMCIAVVIITLNFCVWAEKPNVIFYASYDKGMDADFSQNSKLKPYATTGELSIEKGYKGEGLYLGENSRINYGIDEFNPEKGSLSFWINPKFTQDDNTGFSFFAYYFNFKPYVQYFDFYKSNTEKKVFQYRVITTANGQDKENINKWETSILPENEWSYIVLTWNNKTGIKLYINGSLSSFIDAQWKIPEQTNPKTFFIKNNIGNKGATIDEYRIYNEDLTADEIKKYFMSE